MASRDGEKNENSGRPETRWLRDRNSCSRSCDRSNRCKQDSCEDTEVSALEVGHLKVLSKICCLSFCCNERSRQVFGVY